MNSISKRILSILLVVVMCLTMLPSTAFAATDLTEEITGADGNTKSVTLKDADGDGYYDIGTADELYAFAAEVNGGNNGINGELTADIVVNENVLTEAGDLNGDGSNFRVWTPIGLVGNVSRYIGNFDGGEHTVSGLYLNDGTTDYVGLFGYIAESGKVQNVGVEDFYFNGGYNVGGVVGWNDNGTITNCHSAGAVTGTGNYVGGVAGQNDGTITNCESESTVTGKRFVGGVAGYNNTDGTITNCHSAGAVTGTGNYVGGVAGHNNTDATITNCYNTGAVNSTGYDVGGVAGYNNTDGTITNCYNTGTVTSTKSYVGGVASQNYGTITNCYYLTGIVGIGYDYASDKAVISEVTEAQVKAASGEDGALVDMLNAWVAQQNDAKYKGWHLCSNGTSHYPVLGSEYENGFLKCGCCESATLVGEDYEIGNAGQLFWFAQQVNSGNGSINGKLTANIDLERRAWTPITNFSGTFDGAGFEIKNFAMNITAKGDHGLFGFVKDATVKNFTLYGEVTSTLTAASNAEFKYGVIGEAAGNTIITDIHSYVNFTINDNIFRNFIGGILGKNNDAGENFAIERCSFSGKLNLGGAKVDCTGGIVAYVFAGCPAKLNDCLFDGEIISTYTSAMQVGGLMGYYRGSGLTVTNSLSIGDITVQSKTYMGAIVGILREHSKANEMVTSNYYLTGDQPFGNSSNTTKDDITDGYGSQTVAGSATAVTEAQLKSGEIAYKLGSAWGQTIETDENPVLGGAKVYYGYLGCDESASLVYTNDARATEQPDHIGGTATCAKQAVCSKCGEPYGELDNTNHDETASFDANGFCLNNCDAYEPAVLVGDYYEIGDAGQLFWFAQQVNGGNGSINGKLTADIVVNENVLNANGELNGDGTGLRVWTPIGLYVDAVDNPTVFHGTFDGGNHTVSGLYFNDATQKYVGLFGYTNGASIRNVGVIDSYLNGYMYVGGVVGFLHASTLENCYNAGTVLAVSNNGGVAGWAGKSSTVQNCFNTGNVSAKAGKAGGVVGFIYDTSNTTTLKNCYSTGNVVGLDANYANGITGGVIGSVGNNNTVENCFFLENTVTIEGVVGNGNVRDGTQAVSLAQFVSGEVAYKLGSAFGQTLKGENRQSYPVLGGKTVYKGYSSCSDSESGYTNSANPSPEKPEHNWKDGVCQNGCGDLHSPHTGGTATCSKPAVCEVCGGEYGEVDSDNHTGNYTVEYQWYPYDDGTCYVRADLLCADCEDWIDYDSGDAEMTGSVEATDCQNPGSVTYSITLTLDGQEYTGSETFEVKSDNHVGQFENGFCSACSGYQMPELDPGEDPEWENDDVYLIYNAGQLFWFADYVNNVSNEINVKLMNNIVVPEGMTWTPIMDFYGTFDGNFKTVSGLNVIGDTYVGMFGGGGYARGTIKNLGLTNSHFEGNSYVGGIAGYHEGTIENCYVDGSVTVVGESITGMLVGNNVGTLRNCYAYGSSFVGRFNNSNGSIENCYFLSDTEDSFDGTTAMTAEAFASGEVAYLLQSGVTIYDEDLGDYTTVGAPHIWGQTCGTGLPTLGGAKVYRITGSPCLKGFAYANDENAKVTVLHDYTDNNGFCKYCDDYESAALNEDGYYEIGNAGQLYWFAQQVNSGNGSINGKLTADIVVNENVLNENGELNADSSNFRVWTPIGTNSYRYVGTFDGAEHTVSGLYFNDGTVGHVGLFGYVGAIGDLGTVRNVGVEDFCFNGYQYVGGVAGFHYNGTITNCYSTGAVTGTGDNIGGVVGIKYGSITDCYNTASVSGSKYVGGVVGGNNGGSITDCYNTAPVSGSKFVGGVVGENSGTESTVANCYNIGTVNGDKHVGGVVGYNNYGTTQNCYNAAVVNGNESVGGVVGNNPDGSVTNCYNIGTVKGNQRVGGVVGYNGSYGTVTNCYYLDTCGAAGNGGSMTAEQFASGQVAYLLGEAFGQNIDGEEKQAYPVLGGKKVYMLSDGTYSNMMPGAVAQAGRNQYTTVQEAVDNANGSYVKLLADSAETVTATGDLYLDLNGYELAALTVTGGTLYGMDATTDDYDCADGYGTIGTFTGTYESQHRTDITGAVRRYVAISEDGKLSFHRIYTAVTHTSLKPSNAGFGYKAAYYGDQMIQKYMTGYGYNIWISEDNKLSRSATDFVAGADGNIKTLRINNILSGADTDATAAQTLIYANANAVLTVNGTVIQIESDPVSGTLVDMINAVNGNTGAYSTEQLAAVKTLLETYTTALEKAGCEMDNILN